MPTSITSSGITFDDATTLTTGVVPTANIANAAVTPAKLSQPLTLATAVATTSGTSIDFTGIPSWVKRITVMLNGVSTNGTSDILIQIGTSVGIESTGYGSSMTYIVNATAATTNVSSGFLAGTFGNSGAQYNGISTICSMGSNRWVMACNLNDAASTRVFLGSGAKTLSNTLDRIRLTTVNGTDTFDAGSVNIIYEG